MAQQEINQIADKTGSSGRRKSIFIAAAGIIVVVLALLVALRLYNNHLNNKNNYRYQNLSAQNSALASVDSFSFDKPNEFSQTHKQTQNNTTTAVYSDIDQAGYTIGLLGVSVAKNDQASDAKYLDGVSYLMKEGQGSDYDNFVGYFKGFIGGINGPDYTVQLAQPKAFTNGNIKSKAWVFDITTTSTKGLAPMQGKFVYAAGNKDFYYFAILALQANWQPNSQIWDQVMNSLKIAD